MLNSSQQQAVESNDKNILVLAGAGSGKTTVLISRISRLVEEGINPGEILVLTFTNAAAKEMKERYRKAHKGSSIPKFGTFHSFCYSLIISNSSIRRHMGYTDIPNIATDEMIKKLKAECKLQCGTKLSDAVLEGKESCSSKDKFQFDIFWKQYDKLYRQNNLITFDKMCYEVCELFTTDSPYIQSYKSKYKHIFVDEFQDTDPKQWAFVSSFKDSNLFAVGDYFQSIYQFRGGDSTIIKKLAADPKWTKIKLSQNYRSTKEICEFSNKIHQDSKNAPYILNMQSDRPGEPVVVLPDKNISNIFSDVLNAVNNNNSTAILCRSNAEVSEVREYLKERRIPFRSNAKENKNADIIKAASNSEYCVEWLSGLLPAAGYNRYIKLSTIDPKYSDEPEFIKEFLHVLEKEINKINDVRSILYGDMPLYSKLDTICIMLKIPHSAPVLKSDTVEGLIDYLIEASAPDTEKVNLYVGTIHSVKGLEFDVVYVLGVDGDSFRISDGCEDLLNLYYVACTRAKNQLIVCMNSRKDDIELKFMLKREGLGWWN